MTSVESMMDEERLILQVQEYPVLYDQENPHYSDKEMKENVWREIGAVLNCPANECRLKWQTLRGSFRRTHRILTVRNAQSSKKKRVWRWYEAMSFLIPYMQEVLAPTNVSDVNDSDEENGSELLDTPENTSSLLSPEGGEGPLNRKEKRKIEDQLLLQYLHEKRKSRAQSGAGQESDGLKKFFESMYETVRNFPPNFQIKAKRAVFDVVMDLETQLDAISTEPPCKQEL